MNDLSEPTFWNGLPTIAIRGSAIVADTLQFPMYWARPLVGIRIPVVCVQMEGVNAGGGVSYLDNRDGVGWFKVTKGKGLPAYGHSNVSIEVGSFEEISD